MTTILFKTAVGNKDNFLCSPQALDVKEHCKVYTRIDNNGKTETKPVDFSEWAAEVYRILFRRYMNWQIAYVNVDDMLNDLWERIEIHTPNFYMRKAYYEHYMNMTDAELMSQGVSIQNFVDYTGDLVENPLDTAIENITTQTSSKSMADTPSRLRSLISSSQYTLIEDFCKKFKSLFLKIYMSEDFFG